MFGSKARKIKRLEAIFAEEGKYLETARVISEEVKRLAEEEAEQYDELVDQAFGRAAEQAALVRHQETAPAPKTSAESRPVLHDPLETNGKRLQIAALGTAAFTGTMYSLMSAGIFVANIITHEGAEKVAGAGGVSLAMGFMAVKSVQKIESIVQAHHLSASAEPLQLSSEP